jgi:hypothetical protein
VSSQQLAQACKALTKSNKFSAESDVLVLSGGLIDVGPQGENINFLSPSSHQCCI